jgi:initiation factor 1A
MPPKKKKNNNTRRPKNTIEIQYADSSIGQEYGYVDKLFGNCHFKVNSIQGEERVASLSGIMKKRCRVINGDLVLMEPMSESIDTKYQIIFRYTQDQKKILEKEGRLKKVEVKEETNNDDYDNFYDFEFEGENDKRNEENKDVDEWFVDKI